MPVHKAAKPESEAAIRVRALEAILTEKGLIDPKGSMRWSIPTNTKSGRATVQRSSLRRGSIRSTKSDC